MLNIIGISLSFLGTIITLWGVITNKSKKGSLNFNEFDDLGTENVKNRTFSIWGLSIMSVGFLLQLYVAVVAL